MFRSGKNGIKVFDSQNPEYSLIDSMTSEIFENYSTEIAYWLFGRAETEANLDELDEVYGESSKNKRIYSGPFDVKGTLTINPIIQELTRLGLEQIEEIDFYCNIAAMDEYLEGEPPKAGDIFRVTWIEKENTRRYVFYSVANVTPTDIYNSRYINYLISAEQTTLHNFPAEIKNYYEGA